MRPLGDFPEKCHCAHTRTPAGSVDKANPAYQQRESFYHEESKVWAKGPATEARDQIHVLMDSSWVYNPLIHNGNPLSRL